MTSELAMRTTAIRKDLQLLEAETSARLDRGLALIEAAERQGHTVTAALAKWKEVEQDYQRLELTLWLLSGLDWTEAAAALKRYLKQHGWEGVT